MNKQELDDWYLAALEVEEAGDYERALAMMRRGAELGDAHACNAIGLAYDAGRGVEQNKEHAIEWFKRAYNHGENVNYCANIALTYAEIGQLEWAGEWWKRAIDGESKSASLGYAKFLLRHQLYRSCEQIAQLLEVASHAEASAEVSPDEKEEAQTLWNALKNKRTVPEIAEVWRAHEADVMFEAGGEAAKTYFAEIARAEPQDNTADFFLMRLAIDERDFRCALAFARKVKALNRLEQNLNLNIGRIYELAGTYDKAIAFYKKELALFPDNELAYFNLGTTFFKMRRWNKAIFCFERALAATDDDYEWEALSYLNRIYYRIRDIKNERRIYRRTIDYAPDSAVAMQNLGATYFDTRDYARALEILQRAKTLDFSDAMIDRNIARARRALARESRAPKS